MTRKTYLWTSIYYTLIFMAGSGLTSYLSLFYEQVRLPDSQIGLLTSLGAIVALVSNPFWGVRGDRARTKNRVLAWCLILAAASVWLLPLSGGSFGWLVAATIVFFFFQTAVNPLSDSISLELASRESFPFSKVRTAGSLGYAIMSMVGGWLIGYHVGTIFLLYSLLILASLFAFRQLPPVYGHQRNKAKLKFWEVARDRSLRHMYLYVLVLSAGFGFFFSFHALYSVNQGISTAWLGVGIMLGSFSQFPFMLLFDRLYDRFGIRNIILVSGLLNGVRWIIYAFWLNAYTLPLLWLMHGGTYIVLYLCLAEYVHRHVRKELHASGQMMNAIVLTSAGRIIGGMLGGICAQGFGYGPVFAAAGILSLGAVAAYWLTTRKASAPMDTPSGLNDSGAAL